MNFEEHVKQEATRLRELFQSRDLSRICINVEIDGRVHDELLIKFSVGEYGAECTAGSLDAAVEEYFRRKSWSARNNPLCLPNVE